MYGTYMNLCDGHYLETSIPCLGILAPSHSLQCEKDLPSIEWLKEFVGSNFLIMESCTFN